MQRAEFHWDSILRMVEGLILGVLDKVSISGKWYKRDIRLETLIAKRRLLRRMKGEMLSKNWDIWLDLYCEHFSRNKYGIKKNFEAIRKKSVKYVNCRIASKLQLN